MEKKSGTEMSREKQIIEEMRKEVASIHRFFLEDDDYESLDEYIADMLYNAGYRKQSKGEWIKTSEFMPIYGCSVCKERNLFKDGNNVFSNFCPNCGAKMKGGE